MAYYETKYGHRGEWKLLGIAVEELAKHCDPGHATLKVLDIGCGNMSLSESFLKLFTKQFPSAPKPEITGWDISLKGIAEAREKGFNAENVNIGTPLTQESHDQFDIVLFLEVIEHLENTDQAMENIKSVLKPGGTLVLTTPNLAAWYNRIFLLMGMQPHCTEVSYHPTRFGNPLTEKFIKGGAVGHLRLFTWRALKQYLEYYQFSIKSLRGCSNHGFDFISRFFSRFLPRLSGSICVLTINNKNQYDSCITADRPNQACMELH